MSTRFDATIIGSGIGGLTCGAFLARAGMRVCVLERHSKIGGYAHNFKRKNWTFEAGIHSVPMGKGGIVDHLLNLLGVADRVQTIELPEMYHLKTPSLDFSMPSRRDDIHARLNEAFPHERRNLDRLFDEFKKFDDAVLLPIYSWEKNFIDEDKQFVSRFHNTSYEQFISEWISDDSLRRCFFGQWPYGGGSPDFGGALFYSIMFLLHYRDGTHGLRGGFSTLADALAHVITSRGGEVRTRSEITGLTMAERAVRSVRLADGTEIETDFAVSNTSPFVLHRQLLPQTNCSSLYQRRLAKLHPSISAFAVYCGLNRTLSPLMPQNTSFWFASDDNAAIFSDIRNDRHENPGHLIFLRSPDESAAPTLTLLYFCQSSGSDDWKRDKAAWTDRLLALAERIYPGLSDYIGFVESGTPSTFERYTRNTGGALYGFENTKDIYGEAKLPVTTHIGNLFQTGHWGKPGCGVLNVMVNAYTTYHTIMRSIK